MRPSRLVHYPARNCCVALMGSQADGLGAIDLDDELTVEDEEELVLEVVLVPVKVAFEHSESYDNVVDP